MVKMGDDQTWVHRFLSEVEAGHSAKTLQLVAAVCGKHRDGHGSPRAAAGSPLDLVQLRSTLEREGSAAARNRIFRRWLAEHRDDVVASWLAIGFPAPPSSQAQQADKPGPRVPSLHLRPGSLPTPLDLTPASTSPPLQPLQQTGKAICKQQQPGANRRATGITGVAVFDFDQTLTCRHVGVFEDLEQVLQRSFGGPGRMEVLHHMFDRLRACHVAILVVTRNSAHVVKQALGRVGIMPYVNDSFIFGFEDYGDNVPKSRVIREKILEVFGLRASALLFVDDDPSNIADVDKECPGCKTIQPPRHGLQQEHCDQIVAWAEQLSPE